MARSRRATESGGAPRHPTTEQIEEWLAPLARSGAAAYYVGGCVRDWLMGRRLKDIDVVVAAETWPLGQAIAARMGAHLFWLREEEGVARVLKPGRDGVQVDLSPLVLPIEEDLRARDFTVNAMAVPLEAGLRAGAPILDPTDGREDLARRCLRLAAPDAITRDPLRLMRAVRLSLQLGFRLEPETETRVRAEAASLARVSAERVRDELFQMLPAAWAPRALARLRDLGLLPLLLPGAAALSTAAWADTLARVRALGRLAGDTSLPRPVRRRLREPLVGGRPRSALLKWGALLEAAGEGARQATARLKLGSREGQLLATLLREEERAVALLAAARPGGLELHRFVRATGGWAIETLLFAATRTDVAGRAREEADGPLPAAAELSALLERVTAEEAALAAPLLSGVEVMNLLGLPAGPSIGRWLEALAEARAERIVTTPAEARAWLLQEAERRAPNDRGSDRADAD